MTESPTIKRNVQPGFQAITVARSGLEELHLTATPNKGDDPRRMFTRIQEAVSSAKATIVTMDVFGLSAQSKMGLHALRDICGTPDWPVTWLTEGPASDASLAGVQVHAIRGVNVKRIHADNRVVGSLFEDKHARHCYLGDLWVDPSAPRGVQARRTFEMMENILKQNGMSFDNVVRTWLYLYHILEWYDELNAVRNQFYRERNVFGRLVPASTGIGSANAANSAIIADAYAIVPLNPDVKISALPSPLQCPALDYGSSFSRAVEIDTPDHREITVSGTASIEPGGKTVHLDDIKGQVQLTMDVVEAILLSRGMKWQDVARGIAYVKRASYAAAFYDFCAKNKLQMPFVTTENDVCRDDLLFEIELEAVTV